MSGTEVAQLRAALWQCGVEAGMDTDGNDGPGPLVAGMGDAAFAAAMLEEVRQLRKAYDECLAEPELCPDCVGTGYVRHAGDFHFRISPATATPKGTST